MERTDKDGADKGGAGNRGFRVRELAADEIAGRDAGALRELLIELAEHHNAVSEYFGGLYPGRSLEETLGAFEKSVRSGGSLLAAVSDEEHAEAHKTGEAQDPAEAQKTGETQEPAADRRIAGFCKIDLDPAHGEGRLDYLVVGKKDRGRGLGGALMDWAMDRFGGAGIRRIEVKVVAGNQAVRLYEKYGFRMNAHVLTRLVPAGK